MSRTGEREGERKRDTETQLEARKQVQTTAWFRTIKTKHRVHAYDRKLEKK